MRSLLALLLLASTSPADEKPVLSGTVKTARKVRPKPEGGIKGDPKCACLHEEVPKVDTLVVAEDGGVQWALVRITKGLEGKSFTPPKEPVVLDQKGCVYVPHVVGAMAGQPVEFRNSDDMLHNVNAVAFDNPGFNIAQLKGAVDRRTFARPEILKVVCNVHPWMAARIGVFDHPYFAVTDAAGRFEIKGLPPGKYSLEAWHEELKGEPQEVVVGGKDAKPVEFVLK